MLPLLFIGVAAATGGFGVVKTAQAASDNKNAGRINKYANESVNKAKDKLEIQRQAVTASLEDLGSIKVYVLEHSVVDFLDSFQKIKNVDFSDSEGLDELKNLQLTKESFKELKELSNFAVTLSGGAAAGLAGGALTAFGAWGAASTFAAASTGTAISTLSGAAATNATLAFFGGGSLAAGGLGMAGGAVVLGGLVAGPALAVMGLVSGAGASKNLDEALNNKAQADEIVESLNTSAFKCSAIRRRSYAFYELLAQIDTYFVPLNWQLKNILDTEGEDYRSYSPESKKAVRKAASTALSIKAVLDTPILKEDGSLTEESRLLEEKMASLIETK